MGCINKDTGLSTREEHFCHLYIETFNMTKAYMEVYKRDNYCKAKSEASKLMKNPYVLAYIKKLQDQAKERMQITPEFLIEKALTVYEQATQARPVMKFNPITRQMEESGQFIFDGKAANGALDIIANVTGLKQNKIDAKLSLEKVVIKDDV